MLRNSEEQEPSKRKSEQNKHASTHSHDCCCHNCFFRISEPMLKAEETHERTHATSALQDAIAHPREHNNHSLSEARAVAGGDRRRRSDSVLPAASMLSIWHVPGSGQVV